MKRYLPFVIIASVLVAAIGAGVWMFRSAQPNPATTPAATPALAGGPVASPDVATSKGVVIIEEFGDYQCPPCGALHPILKTLKSEFGDRIKLIFRHFPLTTIHKHALEASFAAAAAGLQGKFWEMHDTLYENQSTWSDVGDFRPVAINYARRIGLDVQRFTQDMDGLKVMGLVSADEQRANAFSVNSTPTVFIDGRLVANENMTVDGMRKEINQRLSVSP
ncbi:MAG TPA: thioredoxin domain-containing protein [Blastocatellia bacterium]|nr:thioredoxin domain-containing protein [Blastocatellia bacterium]